MTGFAIGANESLRATRDSEWFKEQLIKRGVSGQEIAWGDYRTHYLDVPPQCIEAYLQLRPKMLHRKALEQVLKDAGLPSRPIAV